MHRPNIILAVSFLLLAGCVRPTPQPQIEGRLSIVPAATQEPTFRPKDTDAPPTNTERPSATPRPSTATTMPATDTSRPAATASPTALPTSEPSPTLPPDYTPPPPPTPQPTPLARLGESYWGSHDDVDRRYFFVMVTNKDLVPKALYILDQDSGTIYGPYALEPAPESHYCNNLDKPWLDEKWYQTDGIEPARWPADFSGRVYSESFIYQIELQPGAEDQPRIEISEPPGWCQGGTP